MINNKDIRDYIHDCGFSMKDVAEAKGISLFAMFEKLKNPMTLEEEEELKILIDNMVKYRKWLGKDNGKDERNSK